MENPYISYSYMTYLMEDEEEEGKRRGEKGEGKRRGEERRGRERRRRRS